MNMISLSQCVYRSSITHEQVPVRLGFHEVNCAQVTFVAEVIVKQVSPLWISYEAQDARLLTMQVRPSATSRGDRTTG